MESFLAVSLLSVAMYNIPLFPWSALFVCTRPCGIRYYIVRDKEVYATIQKKVQDRSSATTDDGRGFGFSFGFWYCLNIREATVEVVATQASYERLLVSAVEAVLTEEELTVV
jgi:hypothetical protein